jgi:hypothetical protein
LFAAKFPGGVFMGLEDRVWYREMLEKEAKKNEEIILNEKVNNKFPIWRFVIVFTLIVWVTILIFFYMIPLVFVHSIMKEANTLISEALKPLTVQGAPSMPQVNQSINQITEKPLPENGWCRMFYAQNKAVATFKITAEPYNNYYVRLVDHFNNPKLLIFVRAGETTKVRVPLGVYELKWTRGEKWFGKDVFGTGTVFRKAAGNLIFSEEETKSGNKIFGNTINFNKMKSDTPLIKTSVNEF